MSDKSRHKVEKLTIRDLQEFREIESSSDMEFEKKVEVLRMKHNLTKQETARVLELAWKLLPEPNMWD